MAFDFSDNVEAQDVIHLINSSENHVFLTGRAGTGKTTLLNEILKQLTKKYITVAPTGLSAININGKTIHSLFQLPLGPILPGKGISYSYSEQKRLLLEKLELLVIDEISMVRADLMDAIDENLRYYRSSNKPFGGIQLLLVGDSFQLPPIIKENEWHILKNKYSSLFFFDAQVFSKASLLTVELERVYRQQEPHFLKILDAIRLNRTNKAILSELNERRCAVPENSPNLITLATNNKIVEVINGRELNLLPNKSKTYVGKVTGIYDTLPVLRILEVKVGAQVMIVKNDYQNRWVNGSIGIIRSLKEEIVEVELNNGLFVKIEREYWTNVEYHYDTVNDRIIYDEIGTYLQFPIKLNWAMTIHKSQGMTFDQVMVDLGTGTWDSGQAYVALSRCRTLNGLFLRRDLLSSDIVLSDIVLEFSNRFNNEDVYLSSSKAKKISKLKLFQSLSDYKLALDHTKVIETIIHLELLPNNLIESYHLLAQRCYCLYRTGQVDLANDAKEKLEKFESLKQSIGLLTYDSILGLLKGAELLNNPNQRRGAHKIITILQLSPPETSIILNELVFDLETFNNINTLSP